MNWIYVEVRALLLNARSLTQCMRVALRSKHMMANPRQRSQIAPVLSSTVLVTSNGRTTSRSSFCQDPHAGHSIHTRI